MAGPEFGKENDVDVNARVAVQTGREAVSNPVEALIEIITNCLDSYYRMRVKGIKIPKDEDDKAEVLIVRKKRGDECIIGVKDWAEGMTAEKLESFIGEYGGKTSGKEGCQSVRGFYGRGLKDAVTGLRGVGTVVSRKDGRICAGMLYVKNDKLKYIAWNSKRYRCCRDALFCGRFRVDR